MCALELLAKLLAGGDNLVDALFEGLQVRSRLKITSEPRKFIEVDNHEPVKIGELEKNMEAINGGQAAVQLDDFPEYDRPSRCG